MLQRSPTYLISASNTARSPPLLRKRCLPKLLAIRGNALLEAMFWFLSRKTPVFVKWPAPYRDQKSACYDIENPAPRYSPCLVNHSVQRHHQRPRRWSPTISTRYCAASVGFFDKTLPAVTSAREPRSASMASNRPRDKLLSTKHMLERANLFWCVGYTNGDLYNATWTRRPHLGDEPMDRKTVEPAM